MQEQIFLTEFLLKFHINCNCNGTMTVMNFKLKQVNVVSYVVSLAENNLYIHSKKLIDKKNLGL